mgnify:CR=1 FL=1
MVKRSLALPSRLLVKDEKDLRTLKELRVKKANYGTIFSEDSQIDSQSREFSYFGDTTNPYDSFGRSINLHYGILDNEGDVVVPKHGALRTVGDPTAPVFGVDFAARAFNDFRDNFVSEEGNRKRIKIKGSPYETFLVTKGYTNLDSEHSKILEDTYTGFLSPYMRENYRESKIQNFDEFLFFFLNDFYPNVMMAEGIYLSRSNFALSRKCTRLISGMVFELAFASHNSDYEKYQRFLSSDSYDVIKDGAAVFGFMIDRNAPWRFVANLKSPRILKYVRGDFQFKDEALPSRFKPNGAPLGIEDVYPFYFKKVYKEDLKHIKDTLLNIYNHHVGRKPYTTKPEYVCGTEANRNPTVVTTSRYKVPDTMDNVISRYPDSFWLSQYLNIRLMEIGIKLNPERLEKEKGRIKQINDYLGYDSALEYVHSYAKGYGFNLHAGSDFKTLADDSFLTGAAVRPKITGKTKNIEETVS